MTKNHHILIVEDEMVISMELAGTLKRLGYVISGQVIRGEDAIEKAGTLRPDLVLMDIMLQGVVDGIEAADRIRELYDIPVVFLTAHSDEATLQRAIAVQPSGYLIKPFRDRELYSTIELSLHKHDLRRRMRPPSLLASLDSDIPDNVPCLVVSLDWFITSATEKAADILGTSSGSLIQTRFDTWLSLTPGTREPVILPASVLMKKADGTLIPVTLSLGLISLPDGIITGYLVVLSRRDLPA